MHAWFSRAAILLAEQGGKPWFFAASLVVILGSGFAMWWSEGWQLWSTTAITIINWQFMILILLVQARDTKALQLKLAELIRAMPEASNELRRAEDLDERQLDRIKAERT